MNIQYIRYIVEELCCTDKESRTSSVYVINKLDNWTDCSGHRSSSPRVHYNNQTCTAMFLLLSFSSLT